MHRLVIDVTYLAHWQGKLTGIPRVIQELASRYAASTTPCVFVVWDNQASEFIAVDIDLTMKNRGSSLHYLSRTGKSKNARGAKAAQTSEKVLRKLRLTNTALVPDSLTARLSESRIRAYECIKPGKDDQLLMLMGEWHNQKYIDRVVEAKQSGASLIQVSYDVLPLVQPQYSGHSTDTMDNYNRTVMPLCDLILAISENTKNDLAAWLKQQELRCPPVRVFRLGDDFQRAANKKPLTTEFTRAKISGGDYILSVGTIEARKNHTLLYYVYKLALQRGIILPPLVIVGRNGWKASDFFDIARADPETKDRILFLTDADDQELSWLYDNALFSVYPSFYEGWGLPIAESIMRDVPCIASNTSSMIEIAGDLIDYFSPASADECLAAITHLLNPKGLDNAKKRIKQYQPYTWDKSFKQVDSFIKEQYEKTN
ncbi:MAG: glycosyltransferase [Candidatus Saccharibacteria bacterium]|nr:glycosyltransferase [Candidatus Saccharibacteria bacterium]